MYENQSRGNGYDWNAGMSKNAVAAYEDGQMPKSKLAKILGCKSFEIESNFKPSSWHHSSKFFNKINFYSLQEMAAEDLTMLFRLTAVKKRGILKEFVKENLMNRLGSFNIVCRKKSTYEIRLKELCIIKGISMDLVYKNLQKSEQKSGTKFIWMSYGCGGNYVDKFELNLDNLTKKLKEKSAYKSVRKLSKNYNNILNFNGIKKVLSNAKIAVERGYSAQYLKQDTSNYCLTFLDKKVCSILVKKYYNLEF